MPAQFKTYLPEGTTPINVQDMAFDWNTTTGNLNYRKDNLKLFNGNAVIKTFTCDNLNRCQQTKPPTGGVVCLTSAQVTGQAAITMTYEANGNIDTKNDLGDYVYSATHPNAVQQIMCGNIPNLPQQDISYTTFNKTATVTEGDYELTYTIAKPAALLPPGPQMGETPHTHRTRLNILDTFDGDKSPIWGI